MYKGTLMRERSAKTSLQASSLRKGRRELEDGSHRQATGYCILPLRASKRGGTPNWRLHLLAGFSQRNGYIHLPLAAIDGDLHGVASTVIVHDLGEVLLVLDLLAIDRDDQVAAQHDRDVPEIGALGAATQAGADRQRRPESPAR